MGTLATQHLEPGMVVANTVFDSKHRTLLAAGTTLTERHIGTLQAMGVLTVDVAGQDASAMIEMEKSDIHPKALEMAERLNEARFFHAATQQPFMQALKEQAQVRMARQFESNPHMIKGWLRGPGKERKDPSGEITVATSLLKDEDFQIPSLPMIYHKIKQVVDQPNISVPKLSSVIRTDPSLSAKLLRMVNSSYYQRSIKIEDVSQAVTLLGTDQLCSLALGMTVANTFRSIPTDLVDMKQFWIHSVATGLAARTLARLSGEPHEERFFIAGLLHDVGRLIMYHYLAKVMHGVLEEAHGVGLDVTDLERQRLGYTHADVGGRALREWKFPPGLVEVTKHHHTPHNAENLYEASLVHVANIIANGIALGSSGERIVPPVSPGAWSSIGLEISALGHIIDQVESGVSEIYNALFTPSEQTDSKNRAAEA